MSFARTVREVFNAAVAQGDTMIFRIVVLMSLIVVTLSARAEENLSAYDEATTLLELTKTKEQMDQSIEQMIALQVSQNPELESLKGVMREFIVNYMSFEALKPDLVRIFTNNFTAKELQEINEFYRTPTGQKAVQVMPALLKEGADLGVAKLRANQYQLQRMIEDEMDRQQGIPVE